MKSELPETGASNPQKLKKPNKEHSNGADDRLRDLLEPFTDNLEDTETPAPAQGSQDSDSERTTKVAENQGSIVSLLTSQKAEIATSA